jgi:hypothetical protein
MLINDFVLAARGDIPATNLKEFAAGLRDRINARLK